MLKKLWRDESGAILSVELILIMVLLVIGIIVGMKALRDAVVEKYVELSAAVYAIDPGYGWGGIQYIQEAGAGALAIVDDGAFVCGSYYSSPAIIAAGDPTGIDGVYGPIAVLESYTVMPGDPDLTHYSQ